MWPFDQIEDVVINATTGGLSQHQIDSQIAQAKADIVTASSGADPAVIAYRQAQAERDIRAALTSFKLPGETGLDVGGAANGIRLPIIGNIPDIGTALAKANTAVKFIWIAIFLAAGLYAFNAAAPFLKKATRRR